MSREILFRGKAKTGLHAGKFIYGFYVKDFWKPRKGYGILPIDEEQGGYIEVDPETVGQYTGLTDKNGKKIFEGDIVQYQNLMWFDIQSVVKFGEYLQDGSGGEYNGTKCIGFYVEVDNFTCPDWCDNQPEYFHEYWKYQNILEVARECEIIGNIHDNPELLI